MSGTDEQPLLGLDSSAHPINLGTDDQFEAKPPRKASERLVSLDVFRGITIWFMMLVNNAGGSYDILDHAPWNGVTIADFVMPSFLFIVGAAMTLAFNKLLSSGGSKWSLFVKSFVRSLKLYMLGFLLPPFPRWNLAGIRILGVLQRIGVCYLIASACVIFIPKFKQNASGPFRVLITYMWHWLVALAMLVIYLGLMLGIWVPGCPQRGMLTPACNAAGFIDYHILTPDHMYHHPTCLPECQYFDPEGVLSTFVATVSIFIGLYYGYHLVHFPDHKSRVIGWTIPSVVMIGAGIGIHFAGMPLNKNLYSISFILLMGGSSGILFALSYLLIDVVKFQIPFYPFIWLGSNSIILYCADEMIERFLGPGGSGTALIYFGDPTKNLGSWVYNTIYASWMAPQVAKLIWGISHACIWIIPAFILYRLKIFIRV